MRMLRRAATLYRVTALLGVVIIILAAVYVLRPAGHIPLYDANLVRLAETALEGYCAGETLWLSGGSGNAEKARQCREQRAGEIDHEVNVAAVPASFCKGIIDQGWQGTRPQCLAILDGGQLWPTYDGAITDQWNRARPYPIKALAVGGKVKKSDSRTGERPDQRRQNQDRGNRGYEEGAE